MEPKPDNVDGKVVHRFEHKVAHQVNWSHVVIVLAVLIALRKLGAILGESESVGDGRSEEQSRADGEVVLERV